MPPLLSRKIGAKGQVQIPPEYLAAFDMQIGEHVYFMPNPDKPGTLVLVPQAEFTSLIAKGWTAIRG